MSRLTREREPKSRAQTGPPPVVDSIFEKRYCVLIENIFLGASAPLLFLGVAGCSAEPPGLDYESACEEVEILANERLSTDLALNEEANSLFAENVWVDELNDGLRIFGDEYLRVGEEILDIQIADPDLSDIAERYAFSEMDFGDALNEGVVDPDDPRGPTAVLEELLDERSVAFEEGVAACS